MKFFVCVTYEYVYAKYAFMALGLHGEKAYGVATISRLCKMKGLFCKRALWKRLYSAKET